MRFFRPIQCMRNHPRRWWAALGVLFFVSWIAWSSISVVHTRQDRDRATAARIQESRDSRFTLCLYVNRTNAGIRDYLSAALPRPDDPRLNDGQRDLLRQRIAYGEALFADAKCDDVVKGLPPPPLPAPPSVPTPAD